MDLTSFIIPITHCIQKEPYWWEIRGSWATCRSTVACL